ncbi:hypothetical protein ACQ4PT_007228 [Festuca glaucescens]
MAERSRSSKRCAVAVNPQFRGSRGGVGVDRISGLGNDLLGHILSFVPALEAVRSSALSRRWRRAWTHTPDLKISDELHQDRFLDFARAVLAQYGEAPDIPSLNVGIGCRSNLGPATAAWLRDAMPRVVGSICVEMDRYSLEQLVLPSSLQAKAMALNLSSNFYHKPLLIFPEHPEPAAFSRLTELSLSNVKLQMYGFGEFLSSCFPQLRKLHLRSVYNMTGEQGLWPLILHMDMLEELKVDDVYQLTLLQVVAAKLRLLTVVHCFRSLAALTTDTLVKISAPRLEVISWSGRFPKQLNFLTDVRCVRRLSGLLVYWPSISRIDFSLPDVVHFLETCSGADRLDVCVDIPDGFKPSMVAREDDDADTEAAKPCQGREYDPRKAHKEQLQLGSLRKIRISGFVGTDPEMDLADLLFGVGATLPALERISISSFAQLSGRVDRIALKMKARFPLTGGRWEITRWEEIIWTKNNDGRRDKHSTDASLQRSSNVV